MSGKNIAMLLVIGGVIILWGCGFVVGYCFRAMVDTPRARVRLSHVELHPQPPCVRPDLSLKDERAVCAMRAVK